MFIGSVGEAVVKLEARQKPSQVWLRLQVWLAVLRFHCKVSAGALRFLAPQICLPLFIPLLNYSHIHPRSLSLLPIPETSDSIDEMGNVSCYPYGPLWILLFARD
jgi:hypothetical protein